MTDLLAWDENISNFRFVAWDTETTGSSPSNDHLVELAALAFDEDFESRRFETLVRPPCPMPAEVIKIHGITDAMVEPAPSSLEAFERFFEFLNWVGHPRLLLAHNAGFDVGIVNGEWRRVRGEDRRRADARAQSAELVLDTCMLAKTLLPELPQHRVESLATHFKIETGRLHRAMEDVRVLHEIFLRLLGLAADRSAKPGSGLTLNMLIDIAGGYFVLNPSNADARNHPFRLPPRIAAIEALCGSQAKVAIIYEVEQDYRYITPIAIKMRAFKVYVEAYCHRDNTKKTFRADKILRIGRVEQPC